jgi:UDP-GlcNAc:undecaprenyl-phosphate/decaprenyl-phosphate GlcNAc-1-phosphate transferase
VTAPAGLVPGLVGTAVAGLVAWTRPAAARARVATNFRGRRLPLTLGIAFAAGTIATLAAAALAANAGSRAVRDLAVAAAVALVYLAGIYDDRQPSRVHGLRRHFAELGRGHVTSGIVKLLVILAAAAVGVVASGLSGAGLVIGIPVVAGSANLLNLLDVAPGRALKFGIVCSLGLLAAASSALAWASVGQTAVLLPLDVRERAMLGDAGANTVGFVLGLLLAVTVGVLGLAIALATILAMHAVAETVSLSRVIAATPPLRWLDGLGRLPVEDHGAAPAGSN